MSGTPGGPAADPHAGRPVEGAGPPIEEAVGAVILVHGRGASPADILTIADALGDERFSYLAPGAAGGTWYPYSFMDEIRRNEPGISSGLGVLDGLVGWLDEQGIASSRVVLLGFSQGACLASEYAVRHARRFGGVVAFSGGLIGPPGTEWDYPGSLDGTPVFLGCSDVDPHIPLERVDESEVVLRRMGGEVTKRIFPGMGHLVNDEEIAFARSLLQEIAG
jgi:predicted esterase